MRQIGQKFSVSKKKRDFKEIPLLAFLDRCVLPRGVGVSSLARPAVPDDWIGDSICSHWPQDWYSGHLRVVLSLTSGTDNLRQPPPRHLRARVWLDSGTD